MGGLPALIFCAALGQAGNDTRAEPSVEVRPLSTNLRCWRGVSERTEKLEQPGFIFETDHLGTEGEEAGRFQTEGAQLVVLRGVRAAKEEGLSLSRRENRLVLRLYKGSVLVQSHESDVDVEVETQHGRVTGKEVYFLVTVADDATQISVIDGKVTFSNTLGSVDVEDGMSSRASKGQQPTVAREDDSAKGAAGEPENLIPNPGFEQGLPPWSARAEPRSGKLTLRLDRDVRRRGGSSLRVSLENTGALSRLVPMRRVKKVLKPGTRYLFRLYYRVEDFKRNQGNGQLAVVIWTGELKQDPGEMLPDVFNDRWDTVEGRWARYDCVFKATGPDIAFVVLLPEDPDATSGTVWLDDFLLMEIPAMNRKQP
ncbi:MAG: hypothetical protein HYY16_00150 [Planctomycetes bacterium]|nr:hypothetical protein [Planctomycetota bacterium]